MMHITVKYLGLLADKVAKSQEEWFLERGTVSALLAALMERYPVLEGAPPFQVAVNQKIAKQEQELAAGDEVALLPPFAGG